MTRSQISLVVSIQQNRINRMNKSLKEVHKNLTEILNSELPESFGVNDELRLADAQSQVVKVSEMLTGISELLNVIKR